MELKTNYYNPILALRIGTLMDEANYLPTGENDWKAIYRNLESSEHIAGDYTDEEILAEIEIFYTA